LEDDHELRELAEVMQRGMSSDDTLCYTDITTFPGGRQ
jgi:hypothetical protein